MTTPTLFQLHYRKHKYTPDKIDIEASSFVFKDVKTDIVEFLVVGNYINKIDKHLEFMLGQDLIDYVNFNWKILFKMNG